MKERGIDPQPKTELEERYCALPVKVLTYMSFGNSSRNPLIGDDSKAELRRRQALEFQRFTQEDLQSMIDFVIFRDQFLNPDPKVKP